jgi:hypothetical protein
MELEKPKKKGTRKNSILAQALKVKLKTNKKEEKNKPHICKCVEHR